MKKNLLCFTIFFLVYKFLSRTYFFITPNNNSMRLMYYLVEIAICQNCSMKNKFYNVACLKKGLNMVKIHYISGDIIHRLRYHWSNFLSLRTGYTRTMFNNFCFEYSLFIYSSSKKPKKLHVCVPLCSSWYSDKKTKKIQIKLNEFQSFAFLFFLGLSTLWWSWG